MAKHLADKGHAPAGSKRTEEFTRIERENLPRGQTKTLQQRPETRAGGRKRAYLKIERERG